MSVKHTIGRGAQLRYFAMGKLIEYIDDRSATLIVTIVISLAFTAMYNELETPHLLLVFLLRTPDLFASSH